MNARPYQVGDRVRIAGWGTLGPREGTIIQIDPADPHGRFGPYIVTNGPDGVATCSMNADLTGPEEDDRHTVELLAPVDDQPRTFGYNLVTIAPDGSHNGPRLQSAVTREEAEAELAELAPHMIDGYTTVLVELWEVAR